MFEKRLKLELLEENEELLCTYKDQSNCPMILLCVLIGLIFLIIKTKEIFSIFYIPIIFMVIYCLCNLIYINSSGIWLTDKFVVICKFNKFYKIKFEDIKQFEYSEISVRNNFNVLKIETNNGKKFCFTNINSSELYFKFKELNPKYGLRAYTNEEIKDIVNKINNY